MRKVMPLLVILSLCFTMSCQKQKAKEEEGMFTKAEYEDIEKRTQRKIIHVDTTTLYPSEKRIIEASLEVERTALIKGVKLALGYEMGNGYEIIQFRSDSNSCHYSCPDLYVQLTTDEYKHLAKYVYNTFPKGESEDDVKDDEGKSFHRKMKITSDGIEFLLEGDERCHKVIKKLKVENETKALTYHFHHFYLCQTHAPSLYETIWMIQQGLRPCFFYNDKRYTKSPHK